MAKKENHKHDTKYEISFWNIAKIFNKKNLWEFHDITRNKNKIEHHWGCLRHQHDKTKERKIFMKWNHTTHMMIIF